MAMAGVGINLAMKFPHNQIYLRAYKTDKKGHFETESDAWVQHSGRLKEKNYFK